MNISISYKHVKVHEPVEQEVNRYATKLEKLLKNYASDGIQIHGVFARNPHNFESSFSLNLKLPSGTLHATGAGAGVRASYKQAFSDIEEQVKKHQSRLRHDHEWKRKGRSVKQVA